jgi:hypothetical protein
MQNNWQMMYKQLADDVQTEANAVQSKVDE